MSGKYKFQDKDGIYFISPTIEYWIDLFTRKEFKYIVIDSIKHCQEAKGLIVHGWVIMPSHLHLIVSSSGEDLSGIMRDFKKYTNRKIIDEIEAINESRKEWLLRAFLQAGHRLKRISKYKIWQDGNHPIHLESNKFMQERLNYLHQNPVEAEFVDEPDDYRYSSARDYAGKKGMIALELIQ